MKPLHTITEYLGNGFFDRKDYHAAQRVFKRLFAKYGEPELGRNRLAFVSRHCVIKFPRNDAGVADNNWEGSVSSDTCARGRWIKLDGLICVVQEKLKLIDWDVTSTKDLPDWVGSIDGSQVGYDRKGRLKAYDFGLR